MKLVVCLVAIVSIGFGASAHAQESRPTPTSQAPVEACVANGYEDVQLPPDPCSQWPNVSLLKSAQAVVMDDRLWIFYTCEDAPGTARMVARRFAPRH